MLGTTGLERAFPGGPTRRTLLYAYSSIAIRGSEAFRDSVRICHGDSGGEGVLRGLDGGMWGRPGRPTRTCDGDSGSPATLTTGDPGACVALDRVLESEDVDADRFAAVLPCLRR